MWTFCSLAVHALKHHGAVRCMLESMAVAICETATRAPSLLRPLLQHACSAACSCACCTALAHLRTQLLLHKRLQPCAWQTVLLRCALCTAGTASACHSQAQQLGCRPHHPPLPGPRQCYGGRALCPCGMHARIAGLSCHAPGAPVQAPQSCCNRCHSQRTGARSISRLSGAGMPAAGPLQRAGAGAQGAAQAAALCRCDQ